MEYATLLGTSQRNQRLYYKNKLKGRAIIGRCGIAKLYVLTDIQLYRQTEKVNIRMYHKNIFFSKKKSAKPTKPEPKG